MHVTNHSPFQSSTQIIRAKSRSNIMLINSSLITDLVILSATFWLFLYLYFTRNFKHWKSKSIPYLTPVPFVGNCFSAILMRISMADLLKQFYDSSDKEPYVGVFVCDKPCLIVRDPDLMRTILIKDFDHFYDRSVFQNKRDDPLGSLVLFSLKNPEWHAIRHKLSPVFTSAKMKIFYKLIQDNGRDLVDYLKKLPTDRDVDVLEAFAKFTTDVISSTAFGVDANSLKDGNAQFRYVSRRMFDYNNIVTSLSLRFFFIAPALVKLFRLTIIDKYCMDFLAKEFTHIMAHRVATKTTRNDMIDTLLEIKNDDRNINDSVKLDDNHLIAQAIQFFIAGFETSSSTLTFTLYELACNKQIQDKLREEIDRVLDKSSNDDIAYEEIKKMTYLDKVFKEGLRKYPILPFLDRKCMVDYKIPGTTHTIDKDTSVFISLLGLHNDPKYYPNPETFDPERFSDEEIKKRPAGVYLPFGDGPRNCIGRRFGYLAVKIGLINVLRNFQIDLPDEGIIDKIRMDPKSLLLSSDKKVQLKFTKLRA